ncbi:MAG: Snf7 family protein [Candidatus Thermoplasmatota archaeon]|nr:Snf7 family protein [Candidatus Thermoplasmatota archaeon]MCL6091056.1 Snf7 family protein [Candidatus Thermoplasmatota archaeon]MDA8143692.1 Snf7 family protein [Thermoplasmatales archaeon]
MVQLRKKKKSKQELDLERKLRIRRAKDSMERFSNKCSQLRDSYLTQAVEARRLGNDALVKKFAVRLVNLDGQQKRAKSFVLMMNDMELNLEQLKNWGEMATAIKDFVNIFEENGVNYETITQINIEMEKALNNSEKLSEALDSVLENVGDRLISFDSIDPKSLDAMVSNIDERAVSTERSSVRSTGAKTSEKEQVSDLDKKISESLEEIDRERGKK